MNSPMLTMRGVMKTFPGVKALEQVDLNVYKGEVMALLGENGAGKSTLMKILSGVYSMDEGKMLLNGTPYLPVGPKDAMEKGIAIIHQELNLIEELSIAENIYLGRIPIKLGAIQWRKMIDSSKKILEDLGIDENPRMRVKDLSIGKRQMVEIAKALSQDASIIIMDEPTDALTLLEAEVLFGVIEKLKQQGKGIVYISHRLEEIFKICDRVTVLRDGCLISEVMVEQMNEEGLIEMMVGRRLEDQYTYNVHSGSRQMFCVDGLSNQFVNDVSFDVKVGEVLGIAGLMGAGRTELAKSIYGAVAGKGVRLTVDGKEMVIRCEKDAINQGIVYVSEDRKKDGLVLDMSVSENIVLSAMSQLFKPYYVKKSVESDIADAYISKLSIKTPSANQPVRLLSGGNQQKVSIAKALVTKPKVLILDEPTRGVDVGAKKEIYNLIDQLKADGLAIIVISSELNELLGISDRVVIMREGGVVGEVDRASATQEQIMRYAVGVS